MHNNKAWPMTACDPSHVTGARHFERQAYERLPSETPTTSGTPAILLASSAGAVRRLAASTSRQQGPHRTDFET